MSVISTLIDELYTLIEANLTPKYEQLHDRFLIEENSDLELDKGFALLPAPGVNTNRFTGCQMSVSRDYLLWMTQRVFATDVNPDAVTDVIKDLYEDQFLVIKDIEEHPALSASGVAKTRFVSDEGIGIVAGKTEGFLTLATLISVEYVENLT